MQEDLLIFAAVAGGGDREFCPGATAQPAAIKPGEELRTLNATPMDIAEGKHWRKWICAGCHGRQRHQHQPRHSPPCRSAAGLSLSWTLKAYQSGARGDSAMNNAVKFLSDDALVKVAAYFASLDPAPPPPSAGRAGQARCGAGRQGRAAAACAGCHGDAGVTQIPGIPSLVGLDPKYLVDAMKAYKNGQRKNDTMKAMLASVSERP